MLFKPVTIIQTMVQRVKSALCTLVVVMVVTSLLLLPSSVDAQTVRETRLDAGVVAGIIQGLFTGTSLHLNNFGPRHGNSFHLANDSFVRFSPALGSGVLRFNIPEEIIDKPGHNWKYYVNDINLRDITISTEGSFFKISLFLEDTGNEFKGMCPSCLSAFRDSRAPDVQLNEGRIDILLRLSAYQGSLGYNEVLVNLEGHIQAGGICDRALLGRLCDRTGYREKIRQAVENALRAQLNRDSTRNLVANALRSRLTDLGIGEVIEASIRSGILIIRHQ